MANAKKTDEMKGVKVTPPDPNHVKKSDWMNDENDRRCHFLTAVQAQKGAVYFRGRPGVGKTAFWYWLANEMQWQVIDLRLAQIDECDIGGIPDKKPEGYFEYVPPKWALLANERPTLVIVDEYNRAQLPQRNAFLQVLGERRIGDVKFNEGVYFCATGNLGDEDGCEVEELDAAAKGRLISVQYEPTVDEWCEMYADEHVHSSVVAFIKANPSYYYRVGEEHEFTHATPRSWDWLSAAIMKKYGKTATPEKFINFVKFMGMGYVGSSVSRFIRYLEDQLTISIRDVIDRYDQVKGEIAKANRDKKSELIGELKEMDVLKFPTDQLMNVQKFLREQVDEDEIVGFFNKILVNLTHQEIMKDEKIRTFMKPFAPLFAKVSALQ